MIKAASKRAGWFLERGTRPAKAAPVLGHSALGGRFCASLFVLGLSVAFGRRIEAEGPDYPVRPVAFDRVVVTGGLWKDRIETNRRVTVPYDFRKCEETGRIDNFAKAGGLKKGPFVGIFFNDSDVFKVIEGAAYTLARHPDPKLDAYLDRLIAAIAAAQEEDGYLYTARTLQPGKDIPGAGPTRWSRLASSHELYNVGHLYEAAVAHYRATGKRTLLDVALRNAELLAKTFGPNRRRDVPGHEEIEIGLVKLYRATGDRRWLDLARFFLFERGNAKGHKLYGAYAQDHLPVTQQTEAVGHAVRATYLYCGMADVAALTGDQELVKAIDRIWEDVVSRKMYVTGGIGAQRHGEAFGAPYQLPNDTAYNETCAAIGNALWNHRMFLLHGHARYVDVLERVIYNAMLVGVSLEGDRFFYPNPLSFDGTTPFNHGSTTRQAWFGCSCCPVNVVRFIPSVAGMIYARRKKELYVNLFIASQATVDMAGGKVRIEQQTDYPWSERVRLSVQPDSVRAFTVCIRIPGWVRGKPVPSTLYRYVNGERAPRIRWTINGAPVRPEEVDGFARFTRTWHPGDTIEWSFPMAVRRVVADERVEACRGRVAIERGPIVYAMEGVDHGGDVRWIFLPDDAPLRVQDAPDRLGGGRLVCGEARRVVWEKDGRMQVEPCPLRAVPYAVWNHRGATPMTVWIPRSADAVPRPPRPTIASTSRATASHVWQSDTVAALHDQREPTHSNDHSIPRFTWWDHRGTTEWVEYHFAKPQKVSRIDVYWFDDRPRGGCRLPKSWRLLYRSNGKWKPVRALHKIPVEKDRFNTLRFDPVETDGLRIEVQLRPGYSGGILEWRVS